MKTIKQVIWSALALMLAIVATGQTTNGPILGITKSHADNPAVLKWSSQTNQIYRIEYASELTNWLTVIEDFSTQGTNTLWADLGSESASQPRPSSRDIVAARRFYRVAIQGYMSNALPVTITVSNVSAGAILTEFTNVLASAQSDSNLISGKLFVDGNEVAIDSGSGYSFPLETRFYQNGAHRLSIIVEDGGDTGSTGGDDVVPDPESEAGASYGVKHVSVIFSNFLSDVPLKYRGYHPNHIQGELLEDDQMQTPL